MAPVVHPRAEHRPDRAPELLLRVLRESPAEFLLDDGLVARDQRLPVLGGQVGVEGIALAVLELVEGLLEVMVADVEDHVRIHGDEAPVAVVGEALVARTSGQCGDGDVVQAEVEHRVHHARHRGPGAGADRDEQRVLGIPEGAPREGADRGERRVDLCLELGRVGLVVLVVVGADLGGDGEAGGHRQAQVGHLGEVGALAAQEILHPRLALGLAVTEGINPLRHRQTPCKISLLRKVA